MTDPLATYLHDHLAGSHFAIELLNSLHDYPGDEELSKFAADLRAELKEEQEMLQGIADRIGTGGLKLAAAAGWVMEKASKLKLQRDDAGAGLGTFQSLETLLLGVRGKLALWQALEVIREVDPRIPDQNFRQMVARTED